MSRLLLEDDSTVQTEDDAGLLVLEDSAVASPAKTPPCAGGPRGRTWIFVDVTPKTKKGRRGKRGR